MNVENEKTPQAVRLALVYEVVNQLKETGKIRIQKLMYFLQEIFDAPTNYSFRMHHYGPYSQELETDLARLRSSGYLSVKQDSQGYGYHVCVEDKPEDSWSEFIDPYRSGLESVIELLGSKQTSQLELMATLHFANKISNYPSQQKLIEIVHGLKPKFSEIAIEQCRIELEDAHLLTHD